MRNNKSRVCAIDYDTLVPGCQTTRSGVSDDRSSYLLVTPWKSRTGTIIYVPCEVVLQCKHYVTQSRSWTLNNEGETGYSHRVCVVIRRRHRIGSTEVHVGCCGGQSGPVTSTLVFPSYKNSTNDPHSHSIIYRHDIWAIYVPLYSVLCVLVLSKWPSGVKTARKKPKIKTQLTWIYTFCYQPSACISR